MFDLNIQNYNIKELEELFNLPKNYSITTLELNEKKMIDSIANNNDMPIDLKMKTIDFISKAKIHVLGNATNSPEKEKSLLPEYVQHVYHLNYDMKQSKVLEEGGSHIVQEKAKIPYNTSQPREYVPGIINPLNRNTIRSYLNIDTRFRENYYSTQSTNFTLTLPYRMTKVVSLQLSSFEVPLTFYTISKQMGNNFFTIIIGDESRVISIPSGCYNSKILLDYLNNFVSNLSGQFKDILFTINVLPSNNNSGSGQMLIGIKSPATPFDFTLDFQSDINGNPDTTPLPLKLGWIMGYRNGLYVNNSTYASEGIPNLIGSRYLFLVIDDYNNNVSNNFFSAFTSSILNKNIIARISVQGTVYQELSQNNLQLLTSPRVYFGPVNIERMNVQLLDEYGRIVDLNNMDYSFCLTYQTDYDI